MRPNGLLVLMLYFNGCNREQNYLPPWKIRKLLESKGK
nr:MAG TPA: Putative rRNA methylase [Caudoviricetes sp.]